jgi:PAS domain S-box-containing protein
MSESALPSGTRVVFKAPSLWEQHYRLVIGGLAAFGLQTAVLAVLLVQTRKRRQAERSLQESEERIAYTATSTNTGLWHLDVSSNRGWATERCRSMLGLAPDAPFSREAILCIAHPEDRRQVEDALERATRSGAPSEAELRIVAPGREERWVIMRVHPHVNSHDLPRRIAGIFADVTARKKAEAEVEARRAELAHLMRVSLLGELSGAIAHEINQPLASILLNAQTARLVLAAQSPDLDLVRAVIDDIEADDIRATEVIRRLRRLLRKNESQSEPVDLNGLMESTLRMLRGELVNRKIEVDIALSGDLPAAVGDPVQLQQVLLNLLMNAMDAMGETAPARRLIMVRTRSDSNGTVEAVVADRGRGIAPDEQRRLFEPFFTTKGHGLGLGLSICSSIASAHGGSLTIDNNTDGGATAVFRLPTRPGIAGPP